MVKYSLAIISIFFHSMIIGQNWGDSSILKKDIFYTVEQNPKFGTGIKDYYQYLADNLRVDENVNYSLMQNVITVNVVIDSYGKIVYAEINKGINQDCNNAVIKLVSKMPPWKPGKQNGRTVSCFMTLPIIIF